MTFCYCSRMVMTERQRLVREVLESRGHDQNWLAKKVGISTSYLSDILAGKKRGSAVVLDRIAEATGVELSTLIRVA